MTESFVYGGRETATPIAIVSRSSFTRYKSKLSKPQLKWLEQNDFCAKAGNLCSIPAADGSVEKFICGVGDIADPLPLQICQHVCLRACTRLRAAV